MADGYVGYEDARYVLGQTSPKDPSPYSPPLVGGVYREQSNVRGSHAYNKSYQPQPKPALGNVYSYWRDGEIRYEDQWGRRIYPEVNGTDSGFRLDLWPVKEDAVEDTGGARLAIPGGRPTLREQRPRARKGR